MPMRAHGEFSVELKTPQIVETLPRGGFNAEGIIAIRNKILSTAPNNRPWVLLERPMNTSGLTPDAVIEIANSYQHFVEKGCVAIALEVQTTWQHAIQSQLPSSFAVPVIFSTDHQVLVNQLNECLAQYL